MPDGDLLKVAILYDKTARYTPSNDTAIYNFCEAAIRHSIYATVIGKDDFSMLSEFDGLFIRDTTHPGNHTFEFALEAERLCIKVIDSTTTILQGCNKIWQSEQFKKFNIPHPHTWYDSYSVMPYFNIQSINKLAVFPCVIKIPDSCFSQGVYKCNDENEYLTRIKEISNITQSKLVCQEFIETSYDWRITIFNHNFLFAVKYYMVDKDWKIIKYDRKGNYIDGNHECVPFEKIPEHILIAAYKCDHFLTDGLYGIDIKDVNGKAYVIEINDNPSIDAGVEDDLEGNKIYDTIMQYYR